MRATALRTFLRTRMQEENVGVVEHKLFRQEITKALLPNAIPAGVAFLIHVECFEELFLGDQTKISLAKIQHNVENVCKNIDV